MPCPEDSSPFQSIIDELAVQHDAPNFPPHLTLHAGPTSRKGNPRKILESILPEQVPAKLVATGVDTSNRLAMTLFLRCRMEPELLALHAFVREQSPASEYRLDPHVSLLYADLPFSDKQALTNELTTPLEEIRFDRIRIVEHPSTIESKEDIMDFHDVAEKIFHENP